MTSPIDGITRGWESVTEDSGRHVHVVPWLDMIEHGLDNNGDCVCGPAIEPIETKNHEIHWLITHQRLDGLK